MAGVRSSAKKKKKKKKAPDCLTCGACCISLKDQEAYCDVLASDLKQLDPRWVKRNVVFPSAFDYVLSAIDNTDLPYGAIKTVWRLQRSGPLKGARVCMCAALRGSVLGRVSCSIYGKRPEACREAVHPGERVCHWLRDELHRLLEAGAPT